MESKKSRAPQSGIHIIDESRVTQILKKYQEGSTKDYDAFVSVLASPNLHDETLIQIVRGLKECVILLGNEFELLVGVMLKVNWIYRSSPAVREYQSFVLNLISAHTFYLRACLKMVIRHFLPMLNTDLSDQTQLNEAVKRKHDIGFLNLHQLLKSTLQLVPLAPTVLLPLLEECFPYISKETYQHECYVRNLLQTVSYLPAHRHKILELIIDRMTKLDVRSPRDAIQEAEDNDDDEMDAIFNMEDKNGVSEHGNDDCLAGVTSMSHKDADRLDVMMELMMRYIQCVCYNDGELNWEATKKLYRDLLTVFDKILLPTHASCHVQFIMFYIMSFKEPLVEGFLDYLWKKIQNPNSAPIFRQAATAYMASLLARAKFIQMNLVKACMELMVSYVHRYISQASYATKPDVTYHGPFYSVCQAIFYVFAFRHSELLAMHNGEKFCQSLNLQTIVTSRLNPLRICLPIIANTFASVVRRYQLAFCDTILEKNRRNQLPVVGSIAGAVGPTKLTNVNPLDSFFPFDPYLLQRSGPLYILPLYQEFDGAVVEEEDMPAEEEEQYQDTEDSDTFSIVPPTSPTTDLMMYGTSPGFKT